MQLKTYNEILTEMCDNFDSLISPRSIARTNNNIIYLMFKAIAKGYEVINNVCVTLNNKFNPASCSADDLESIANLVGTKRLIGSASGLKITVTNKSAWAEVLLAGIYKYSLDDDTVFSFVLNQNVTVNANSSTVLIAFSEKYGSYPVTTQNEITVTSDEEIPASFTFACADNTALLGVMPETDNAFRERIISDTTRQDSLVELQTELRNLPYIFDARIKFNNTLATIDYDGYSIPSYHMAIFYSGEARNEIAELVASKGIYPTISSVETETTKASSDIYYYNSVFESGAYPVHLIPFKEKEYKAKIELKINSVYADYETIKDKIKTALLNTMNTQLHKDYVKENELYSVIENLNIVGVDVLNVDLIEGNETVPYISIPFTSIPKLNENIEWVVS